MIEKKRSRLADAARLQPSNIDGAVVTEAELRRIAWHLRQLTAQEDSQRLRELSIENTASNHSD